MAQFHVGPLLAFLDPFGVWLEEGKDFLVRRDGFFFQQAPLHQVEVFGEHPLEVFEGFPMGQLHGLVAQA